MRIQKYFHKYKKNLQIIKVITALPVKESTILSCGTKSNASQHSSIEGRGRASILHMLQASCNSQEGYPIDHQNNLKEKHTQ